MPIYIEKCIFTEQNHIEKCKTNAIQKNQIIYRGASEV